MTSAMGDLVQFFKVKIKSAVLYCEREAFGTTVSGLQDGLNRLPDRSWIHYLTFQALHEQEASLKTLIVEQEKAVKAAAPDEKYLKELEGKISKMKKGQKSIF